MSKRKKYRGPKLRDQWVPHPVALIRVLQGLTLAARRILDVLEIEHCRHGGRENGKLPCTYGDFERGNVQRSSIRPALDELDEAGLVEATRTARRAYADLPRTCSMYRLTYLPTFQDGKWVEPTHDWKKQKARPESTTWPRPDSTTWDAHSQGRNPPLQGGFSRPESTTPIL